MDEPKKSKTTFPLVRKAGPGRPQANRRRLRDASVARYSYRLREVAPWLEDSDMPLVRRWAELQTLISHVFAELREHGFVDVERAARPLVETYRRLVTTQVAISAQLGLSPVARKQLAASADRDDLASLLAKSITNNSAGDDSTSGEPEPSGKTAP